MGAGVSWRDTPGPRGPPCPQLREAQVTELASPPWVPCTWVAPSWRPGPAGQEEPQGDPAAGALPCPPGPPSPTSPGPFSTTHPQGPRVGRRHWDCSTARPRARLGHRWGRAPPSLLPALSEPQGGGAGAPERETKALLPPLARQPASAPHSRPCRGWLPRGLSPARGPLTGPPPAPTRRQRAPQLHPSASGPVTIPRPLDRGRRTSGAAALGPLSLPMGLAGRRRERGGGSSRTGRGLISIGSPDPRVAPAPLWAWPGSGSLCLWWPGSRPQHSGVAEIPTPRHSKGKEGTASPHQAHGETGGEGAGSPGRRAWGRPCCVRMAAPARQRERHPQSLRARGCRGPQPGWGSAPMGSGTGRTLGALVPCGSSFPAPVRGGGQDTAPSSGKGLGSLEPGGEEPGPPGNRAVGGASALPRPPSPGLEAGRF